MSIRKRFSGFLATAVLMTVGGYFVPAASLDTYINALLVAYGLFLGGQTATDYVREKGKSNGV